MLLAARAQGAGEAVGRGLEGGLDVAPGEFGGGQHLAAGLDGVVDGQDGRQGFDLHDRQPRGAAGLLAGVGGDGEEGLAVEQDLAGGQDGVVVDHRAAVVVAGDVGGGDHGPHPGRRADGGEVEADQAAVGDGGQADRRVQQAGRLGQVVGVGGAAGHVQVGALVGQGLADGGRAVFGAWGCGAPGVGGRGEFGEAQRRGAASVEPQPVQQAGGGLVAVGGGGAQVVERGEVGGEGGDGRLHGGFVPRLADEGRLGGAGPGGRRGHAAEGDARVADPASGEGEGEGAAQGGDVLVVALRDLPAAEDPARRSGGQLDGLDEFAGGEGGLPVAGVEILQGQPALSAPLPQHQPCAGGDEAGHAVADRRAVGDVAAQGAGVAHRRAGEAAGDLDPAGLEGDQRGEGVGQAGGGADHDAAVGPAGDGLQLGHGPQPQQVARVAQGLGDGQAEVGGAGDEAGIRCGQPGGGEFGEAARGEEAAAAGPVVEGRQRRQGVQRGEDGSAVEARRRQPVGGRQGVEDGAVAGAAAQVAGEGVGDGRAVGAGGVVLVEGEQAHREAGRAEAALGAVAVRQGPLDRVQAVGAGEGGEVFDGEQRLAVEGGQQAEAGIDGPQLQRAADGLADHHAAGAAVAFGAAFLGAGGADVLAQPVEHRAGRGDARDLAYRAAEPELDGAFAHGVQPGWVSPDLPGRFQLITSSGSLLPHCGKASAAGWCTARRW